MTDSSTLAVKSPDGSIVIVDVTKVIGSDRECDIRLDDSNVANKHARVEPHDGGIEVTDLGSESGTLVDGKAIRGPLVVPAGGSINIAGHELFVVSAGAIEGGASPKPGAPEVIDSALAVSVVTASASGDDDASDSSKASSGVNPAPRKSRRFDDVPVSALGFAGITGGVFVLATLIAYGVLIVIL